MHFFDRRAEPRAYYLGLSFGALYKGDQQLLLGRHG